MVETECGLVFTKKEERNVDAGVIGSEEMSLYVLMIGEIISCL